MGDLVPFRPVFQQQLESKWRKCSGQHGTIDHITKKESQTVSPSKGALPAFMDKSPRNDCHGKDRRHKENAVAAPGKYFQGTQPFLKKTFNASLPPFKFV